MAQKCSFCKNDMPKGRGTMLVKNDGTLSYYCSSKCERNTNLGRDARFVQWTATYRSNKAAMKVAK